MDDGHSENVNSVVIMVQPDESENQSKQIANTNAQQSFKSRSGEGKVFNSPADDPHTKSDLTLNETDASSDSPKEVYLDKLDIRRDQETGNDTRPKSHQDSEGNDEEMRNNGKFDLVTNEQDPTKENNQNSKNRNNVKIFNSPYDYSHIQSRLYVSQFNNNPNVSQRSQRFKRKVRQLSSFGMLKRAKIADNLKTPTQNDQNQVNRGYVKIFNVRSDYSHVKSRLFDSSSNNSPYGSETDVADMPKTLNTTTTSSRSDKKPHNGENSKKIDQIEAKEDDRYSTNRSNVKVINIPSDYSHVKSRLFDSSSNNTANERKLSFQNIPNRSNTTIPSNVADNDELESSENLISATNELDQAKEKNQHSNNRSKVKIFNAPSDYSHVKSRLFNSPSNSVPGGQNSPRLRR